MARICDSCSEPIYGKDDEYIELQVRVLLTTADSDQDQKAQAYGDFCQNCLLHGKAQEFLLQEINWTLGRGRVVAETQAEPNAAVQP